MSTNDYAIYRMWVDRRVELQREARDAALARRFRTKRRRRAQQTASLPPIVTAIGDR